MATKCDVPGCSYLAVSGDTKCLQHKPKATPTDPSTARDGFAWVSMSDVPTTARFNEAANKLYAAIKIAQPGHALKVSMEKFDKGTLTCAQRYALAGGLRIGVRIVGLSGYLWKMTPEQIAAVEQKGERLRKAREKVVRKPKPIAMRK